MAIATTAAAVFEREFLPLRARLIEVAAALDRVARAEGSVRDDPRFRQVRQSMEVLADDDGAADRTERVQLIFSLPYDPHWRKGEV